MIAVLMEEMCFALCLCFKIVLQWSSVMLVSFQHDVQGPGPEGAEGDGAAHQSHLQILAE